MSDTDIALVCVFVMQILIGAYVITLLHGIHNMILTLLGVKGENG